MNVETGEHVPSSHSSPLGLLRISPCKEVRLGLSIEGITSLVTPSVTLTLSVKSSGRGVPEEYEEEFIKICPRRTNTDPKE